MTQQPEARVLVVEDDESQRDLIPLALADLGCEVATAPDGAAALEIVQEFSPTLILLDLIMPVMDGWAFVQAYHQLPPPHAPIIVLTTQATAAEDMARTGAVGFLAKPFELDTLLAVVAQHIRPGQPGPGKVGQA